MILVKEDFQIFCVIVFDGWGARSNLGEKTKSLLAYGVLLTAWWSDSLPCHKHCTRLSLDHNRSCAISDLVRILTMIMTHPNVTFLSITEFWKWYMPSKLCSLDPDRTLLFGKYSPSTKFTLFTIKKDFLKTSEAEGRAWVMNILSGHHYGVSSYTQAHNSVCIKIIWRKISWIISSHFSWLSLPSVL